MAIEARKRRRKKLVVPYANMREAPTVEGIEVYGVHNLRECYKFLTGEKPLLPFREECEAVLRDPSTQQRARFR